MTGYNFDGGWIYISLRKPPTEEKYANQLQKEHRMDYATLNDKVKDEMIKKLGEKKNS
jgi:hypothetical protein